MPISSRVSSECMPSPAEVHAFERSKREGLDVATALQLSELVKTNTPDYTRLAKLRKFVGDLVSKVSSIASVTVSENTYVTQFPSVQFLTEGGEFPTVTFAGPVECRMVGSFSDETVTKHAQSVDILVTVPASSLGVKDHNQFRYLNKRNAFVGVLQTSLVQQDKTLIATIQQTCAGDRPMLEISVQGSNWKVNFIPVPPRGFFQRDKLVSPQFPEFFARHKYSAILCDMDFAEGGSEMAISRNFQHFKEAVVLLKLLSNCWGVYSRQMITGHALKQTLLESIKANDLPRETSALHLLKVTLKTLATATATGSVGLDTFETLLREEMQRRAKLALENFDLQQLFRTSRAISDFSISAPAEQLAAVVASLRRGLTDRLNGLTVRQKGQLVELRGFVNATTANRTMDKGPGASSPEAKEFREFWGTTEIRRFKDASVLECAIFSVGDKTRSEIVKICDHSAACVLENVICRSLRKLAGPFELTIHPLGGSLPSEDKRTVNALLEKVKSLLMTDGIKTIVKSATVPTLLRQMSVDAPTPASAAQTTVLVAEIAAESGEDWEEASIRPQLKSRWLLRILKNLREQKISTAEIFRGDESCDPFVDLEIENGHFRVFVYHQLEISEGNSLGSSECFGNLPLLQQQTDALSFEHPAMEATRSLVLKWTDNRLLNFVEGVEEFVSRSVARIFSNTAGLNVFPIGSAHVGLVRWLEYVAAEDEMPFSERLQSQAKKALALADNGDWGKIMTITDNGNFFDFTIKVSKKLSICRSLAALRSSQSIMAMLECVGSSEKHRLLALRLNRAMFRKSLDVSSGVVLSCTDKKAGDAVVMVPDVVWLVSAIGNLFDGYVEQWL